MVTYQKIVLQKVSYVSECQLHPNLKHPDEERHESDGPHDAGVVVHQGLPAALPPQVELLTQLVIVEMC